ncbi:hypothetical protein GFC01_12980 [Desulfofundulus thermobenzoicus]|uniref:Uncharacterized protein n=1 Tax=Desulfofundulus thermobenzoicus TaxID=29376 RepID=A0A6N7IUB9_9FIRM|nr:hypothetical protein [Desulfofundulus thermobenzoicus]MQL53153.1 hypothetical protein [Desulfofundulus thermobenzoicus]HHW44792.1 hypothetical protein [Desulfotomaculum sp.]
MGRREVNFERAAKLVGGTAMALLAKNTGVRALGAGVALSELLRGNFKGLRGLKKWHKKRFL